MNEKENVKVVKVDDIQKFMNLFKDVYINSLSSIAELREIVDKWYENDIKTALTDKFYNLTKDKINELEENITLKETIAKVRKEHESMNKSNT